MRLESSTKPSYGAGLLHFSPLLLIRGSQLTSDVPGVLVFPLRGLTVSAGQSLLTARNRTKPHKKDLDKM